MVRTLLILTLMLSSVFAYAQEPLGFTEWKTQQISKAQSLTDSLREKALKAPNTASINAAKSGQFQLDQTKDLTISDYFVGYALNYVGDKATMKKIAQKMNNEDTTQILLQYAKSLSNEKEAKGQRSADRLFFE